MINHAEDTVDGVNETTSAGVGIVGGGSLNKTVQDVFKVTRTSVFFHFFIHNFVIEFCFLLESLLLESVSLNLVGVSSVLISLSLESAGVNSVLKR